MNFGAARLGFWFLRPVTPPPPSGGGGCPAPDVMITMNDRTLKPAGELQAGDLVYTMHETTGIFGVFIISAVKIEQHTMASVTFTDGSSTSVSSTHKFFMSTGEWMRTYELTPGMVIKGLDADKTVQSIVELGFGDAVRITVEDAHTYIAGGMVSHNKQMIGGGSVWVEAYMPNSTKRAGEFIPGDSLLLLGSDLNSIAPGTVISNRHSEQNLLTLVSESGIELTCSDNTPLTVEDGSGINSTEALGRRLPVLDEQGFRWEEIVEVRPAGRGMVATIYCKNQCYAAGNQLGRWILTHNGTERDAGVIQERDMEKW